MITDITTNFVFLMANQQTLWTYFFYFRKICSMFSGDWIETTPNHLSHVLTLLHLSYWWNSPILIKAAILNLLVLHYPPICCVKIVPFCVTPATACEPPEVYVCVPQVENHLFKVFHYYIEAIGANFDFSYIVRWNWPKFN